MCGVVGVAGSITAKELSAFKWMLLVDQVRGMDSTGVAVIDSDGEVVTHKLAVNAHDYLDMSKTTRVLNTASKRCLIGHNRAATKGKIVNKNAHPFQYGNITGVHNGTLRNQLLLPDHSLFDVDSENLFYSMDKIGVEETIAKTNGAATLIFWEEEQQRLNMIRNKERPLFFCYSKDYKTVFWASEKWMLNVGLAKQGLEHTPPLELKEEVLLSFDMKGHNVWSNKMSEVMTTKEVPFYKVTPFAGSTYTRKKLKFKFNSKTNPTTNWGPTQYVGFTDTGDRVTLLDHTRGRDYLIDILYEGYYSMMQVRDGITTYTLETYSIKAVPEEKEVNPENFPQSGTQTKPTAKELGQKGDANGNVRNLHDWMDDPVVRLEHELERNLMAMAADDELDGEEDLPTDTLEDELNVWMGKLVTQTEFDQKVLAGCEWCDHVDFEDEEVIPIAEDQYVCAGCYELEHVRQYIKGELKCDQIH